MLNNSIAPWAIKTESLTKEYPGHLAVDELNWAVPQGVVHGFLGPNGAGKTTTLKMVCGLLRPTSGRVLVDGFDPLEQPLEVKNRVGLLPESPPLYLDMTVQEYLSYCARLHHLKSKEIAQAIERVLALTGTTSIHGRLIGNLSKGYRQRIGIAQALIHDPQVVVLDEPTVGLDPESVVEIRQLIKNLKATKTVVFSSHLLHEVEEVCDTVSIIAGGKLLISGTITEIKKNFQAVSVIEAVTKPVLPEQELLLRGLPYVASVTMVENAPETRMVFHLNSTQDHRSDLIKTLVGMGVDVLSFQSRDQDLERIFLNVTRRPAP